MSGLTHGIQTSNSTLQELRDSVVEANRSFENRLESNTTQLTSEVQTVRSVTLDIGRRVEEVSAAVKASREEAAVSAQATQQQSMQLGQVRASLDGVGGQLQAAHREALQHVEAAQSDIAALRKDVVSRLEEMQKNGSAPERNEPKKYWRGWPG